MHDIAFSLAGTPPGLSFSVPATISASGRSLQCAVNASYQYFFTNQSAPERTEVEVEMSVNGRSFTRSNFTVVLFYDCLVPAAPASASLVALYVLLPLFLGTRCLDMMLSSARARTIH